MNSASNINNVTQLLQDWRLGDLSALKQLTPIIERELHQLAVKCMRKESQSHTLQATALVNEAFIKLVDVKIDWQNKSHFVAMAAKVMRQLLVDHAKSKNAEKRRSLKHALTFNDELCHQANSIEDLILVDQILTQLAEIDLRASEIFELTLFGGLTSQEVAETMTVSPSTVERELRFARAWVNSHR